VEREREVPLDLWSGSCCAGPSYPQFCFVSIVWTDSAGSDPRVFKNNFTACYIHAQVVVKTLSPSNSPVTRHFPATTAHHHSQCRHRFCDLDNIVGIYESVKQFVASTSLYFSAWTKPRNSGLIDMWHFSRDVSIPLNIGMGFRSGPKTRPVKKWSRDEFDTQTYEWKLAPEPKLIGVQVSVGFCKYVSFRVFSQVLGFVRVSFKVFSVFRGF
jgi:hypothetical protein